MKMKRNISLLFSKSVGSHLIRSGVNGLVIRVDTDNTCTVRYKEDNGDTAKIDIEMKLLVLDNLANQEDLDI